MKYKGIEVGIPTLEMIQEQIDRMGFGFSASELYEHYQAMNWLTKKHQPIKSLEALVSSYNGSYFLPKRRKKNISKNEELQQAYHFIDRNLNLFIQSLSTIKEHDPQKWLGIKSRLVIIG